MGATVDSVSVAFPAGAATLQIQPVDAQSSAEIDPEVGGQSPAAGLTGISAGPAALLVFGVTGFTGSSRAQIQITAYDTYGNVQTGTTSVSVSGDYCDGIASAYEPDPEDGTFMPGDVSNGSTSDAFQPCGQTAFMSYVMSGGQISLTYDPTSGDNDSDLTDTIILKFRERHGHVPEPLI